MHQRAKKMLIYYNAPYACVTFKPQNGIVVGNSITNKITCNCARIKKVICFCLLFREGQALCCVTTTNHCEKQDHFCVGLDAQACKVQTYAMLMQCILIVRTKKYFPINHSLISYIRSSSEDVTHSYNHS